MWDIDTPAITTQPARHDLCRRSTLKAANRDLHSGMYGGSALNPINALTTILGELQDDERAHPVARLLRPREADQQRAARAMGCAGLRRSGVPRRHRPVGAGGRARLFGAGAAVGAPDRRHQRHLGRLHRRRQQDGDRRRRPARRFRSAWCRARTRPKCSTQFKRFVAERLPAGCHGRLTGSTPARRRSRSTPTRPGCARRRQRLREEYGREPAC